MAEHPQPMGYRIRSSLGTFFPRIARSFLLVGALALISLLLVLPAWYLASTYPQAYTWGTLSLVALALLIRGILSLDQTLRRYGVGYFYRHILVPYLVQRVPSLVLGILGVVSLFFFLTENYAPAALLALLFFLGIGLRIL